MTPLKGLLSSLFPLFKKRSLDDNHYYRNMDTDRVKKITSQIEKNASLNTQRVIQEISKDPQTQDSN